MEIFAGFYFRKTSHMRGFAKISLTTNGEITLSTTDEGKTCPSRDFFRLSFYAIRENKILAKNSGFTVYPTYPYQPAGKITRAPPEVHYTPVHSNLDRRDIHSCARHIVLTKFIIL